MSSPPPSGPPEPRPLSYPSPPPPSSQQQPASAPPAPRTPTAPPPPPPSPGLQPPSPWIRPQAVLPHGDGLAVAAMVLGIVCVPLVLASLFLIYFLFLGSPVAVVAIVLGVVAQSRVSASGGALRGAGMAITGWICGTAALAFVVVVLLIGLAASVIPR